MIDGKTDREIAILGGALLEGMLFDLLKETVVDSPFQKAKTLFDYPKPLGSFGNIHSLAFAFGVISETEFSTIGVVKTIRNYAAHSIGLDEDEEFDFTREPVRSMLFEFYPKIGRDAASKELRDKVKRDFDNMMDHDPKMAFRLTFCLASMSLLGRQAISKRLLSPAEINADIYQQEIEESQQDSALNVQE